MSGKKGAKGQTQSHGNRKSDNNDSSLDDVRKFYEEQINILKTSFDAKIETLHKIIDKKDEAIGKLNNDIGELRQSLNYLSGETSDIKKCVVDNAKAIKSRVDETDNQVNAVRMKTVDLEDRSRRSNLVFFNFPEASRHVTENCETMVEELLHSLNVVDPRIEVWMERAHRLGRRRPEHDTKPRPIIVKFSYFKQKELIIKNGSKFRNCHINVSEDYSKDTLNVHSQLRRHGKDAKENLFNDPVKVIKNFKVGYRRLVLTYSTNKDDPAARTFTRSLSLEDIAGNTNWYIPPQRNIAASGYQEGYQEG